MRPFILAAVASLFVMPALAQSPVCGPTKDIYRALTTQHQEKPVWAGEVNPQAGGGYAVVFQSESGTWTILQVLGETSCVVGAGHRSTSNLPGEGI